MPEGLPSSVQEEQSSLVAVEIPSVVQPGQSKDVKSTTLPTYSDEVCSSMEGMNASRSELCEPSSSQDMSMTVQPIMSSAEVCKSKDGEDTSQYEVCQVTSMMGMKYDECDRHGDTSMVVTECDSAGSVVIGEEPTNQETDERSCAKPISKSSKGYISMGGKALGTKFFKNIP